MHIGILQTGHVPDALRAAHGDHDAMFARMLAADGFRFTTWNVVDMELPEGPHAADGWLITGSRHGAYEDHPWIPPLEALIRAAHAAGVAMVGVCFGHQIMAQALGGRVEKVAGGWCVGRQSYDIEGERVALNAWHQDQVVEAPAGAELLATSPACRYAAFGYGGRAFSVQAHPEFDDAVVADLIAVRGAGVVPEDRLDAARAGLGAGVDSARIARRIAGVLRQGAAADA